MKLELQQRGRSQMEFIGAMAMTANAAMLPAIGRRLAEVVDLDGTVDGDIGAKRTLAGPTLEADPEWRMNRLMTRWVSEQGSRRGVDAFDEVGEAVEAAIAERLRDAPPVIEHPGVPIPRYWEETAFHLTMGGWDGHPHMGLILEELVYKYVIVPAGVGAVQTGENILSQRDAVANATRIDNPKRIFEPGCGVGRFMSSLQRAYPDAQVVGCELSASNLEVARLVAAEQGWPWQLHRVAAETTELPDASFDLVASYTLLHETPIPAAKAITAEAYRLLRPGGELVHADVPPYTKLDPYRALINDWETENREEPFWRAASIVDRPVMLRDAGFADVEEVTPCGAPYPWVTRGLKPEAE